MNKNYDLIYFVKKYADSSWKLSDSAISCCDMTFILDGEAIFTSGNRDYLLRAGDAIFLPTHSDRYAQTKGMQCAAFNFTAEIPIFPCVTKFSWYNDPELKNHFIDFQQAWQTKTDIDKLKCDGLFLLIVSRVFELQQSMQCTPHVLQMKKYIHKHYTDKITVQMIADHVQLNPVYCGSLFCKEAGDTILHYINKLRVVKAKELLQCTNASVSQIALDVGVQDLYYFSRMFKNITGVSPQQYRLKNGEKDSRHPH